MSKDGESDLRWNENNKEAMRVTLSSALNFRLALTFFTFIFPHFVLEGDPRPQVGRWRLGCHLPCLMSEHLWRKQESSLGFFGNMPAWKQGKRPTCAFILAYGGVARDRKTRPSLGFASFLLCVWELLGCSRMQANSCSSEHGATRATNCSTTQVPPPPTTEPKVNTKFPRLSDLVLHFLPFWPENFGLCNLWRLCTIMAVRPQTRANFGVFWSKLTVLSHYWLNPKNSLLLWRPNPECLLATWLDLAQRFRAVPQ